MTGDMETKGDGEPNGPLRTSDRLRQRSKIFTHTYIYYNPNMRRKNKAARRRTAAARIVNFLRPRNRPIRNTTSNLVSTNLRRSTRKRKISINLDDYETDSSRTEDVDLMQPRYRSKNRVENNASQDDFSTPRGLKKNGNVGSIPRREGLRPRRSAMSSRGQPYHESEGDRDTYEGQVAHDETENGNDVDGRDDVESEEGDEIEEDGEDEDAEEQEGRRRYDLRNRAEVRRFSPDKEGKQRPQSPRRVLHQGMNGKNKEARRGSSRVHKRHRLARPEDSDDSLLVDELDQGPATPWMRSSSRSGAPWLFGGLDLHGSSSWGLNVASSGWGHQGDTLTSLNTGIQTAGPSSKGGADIQPIQVDDGISFDDIGGLSEYIDALKEMVFFPLLYPDFFASYHITPPRGVLLCGPPGTGKTLIARALACAASRAGQKVSFYMRKGADVLSKWVGEAERQLKLLFEEAQKNQPSIIFFDEIDGLAPVRSSKQEQIHNSIVSTLLALMDGLDSRGQVVLIGATNRIDAIDGALRRPGRFDREFVFPLPGSEARAEILDIHTRKWKAPPSKELKTELAASCVGYCGADIKALCTEAAIRAFREKYPQVYTSDDKFLIDVDSIRVEKYHFLEAMSTITPAAHRGSVVISRPLSSVVAPCLESQVLKIMKHIFDIFPFSPASDVGSTTLISYGNSMSLVYRPRLLICGDDTVGLDHVGPAVLHQLEKFPVHSLGLPSLLSDPSAKSPEEALVHIFSEARRATPSVLYLPQFQLWWDTAHHQLKAVLLSLLDELPSDFPILLLGTSSVAFSDLEEDAASLFGDRNVYRVEELSLDDRSKFVDKLVEDILSISSKESEKSKDKPAHSELPKVPREVNGPKASELQAKAEAEQHALRRLRMCLRDVCNRILYDKRFTAFHYPVTDEDAPNYHSIVHNPMDVATLLQRVDCGLYLTRFAFLQDVDLIVSNAKAYNGEDYNGARIVSRACELRDVVHGMLSQMDPALVSFCDKISAQGGPVAMPDDVGGLGYSTTPVVQQVVTRTSARLRNVQPEVNLSQSYEVLRRQKKNNESEQAAVNVATTREKSQAVEQETPKTVSLQGPSCVEQKSAEAQKNVPANELLETSTSSFLVDSNVQDVVMKDADISDQVNHVQQCLKRRIENFGIPQLERLYAQLVRRVMAEREKVVLYDKCYILKVLSSYAEDDVNF